jgi:hypothetical protein
MDEQMRWLTSQGGIRQMTRPSTVAPSRTLLLGQTPDPKMVEWLSKHGVGMAQGDPVLKSWSERLADWLRVRELIP